MTRQSSTVANRKYEDLQEGLSSAEYFEISFRWNWYLSCDMFSLSIKRYSMGTESDKNFEQIVLNWSSHNLDIVNENSRSFGISVKNYANIHCWGFGFNNGMMSIRPLSIYKMLEYVPRELEATVFSEILVIDHIRKFYQ